MSDLVMLFVILIVLGIVVLYPLGIIWSVNALFATGVPYTFKTWMAAFLLTTIFSPAVYAGKTK